MSDLLCYYVGELVPRQFVQSTHVGSFTNSFVQLNSLAIRPGAERFWSPLSSPRSHYCLSLSRQVSDRTMKAKMNMNIVTPPSFKGPEETYYREIEALEPGAIATLVRLCNDSSPVSWAPPSPSLPPPRKRIRRKWRLERKPRAEIKENAAWSDDTKEAKAVEEHAVVVPSTLYAHADEDHINPLHTIMRRDILEVFVEQSRHRGTVGKIGLRCKFCKHLPNEDRAPLSAIYPETLEGLYRACCVRFQKRHLVCCELIPDSIRERMDEIKEGTKTRGSKQYWVDSAYTKGFRNSTLDGKGIIFSPDVHG